MKRVHLISPKHSRASLLILVVALLTAAAALSGCGERDIAVIGHSGGPLLAAVHVAEGDPEFGDSFELSRLGTPADVGYALLSGDLDAGFIDPARYEEIEKLPGFEKLDVVGKITYPFGATLVVREGLDLRLGDLEGKKIGISQPGCALWETFKADAERLNVDSSALDLQVIPFDAMIPALEAGTVDAVVLRGALAAAAVKEGHTVLYQNWEVEGSDEATGAGDGCCSLTADQVELILLAGRDNAEASGSLPALLARSQSSPLEVLRAAAARATGIPVEVLASFPVGRFEVTDRALIEELLGHDDEQGDDDDS
jgi:ABC-type nitrate/sulfonate/bicarbonate transport system substrate-binding protein